MPWRQRKPQEAQEITGEDPNDTDSNAMPSALGIYAARPVHTQKQPQVCGASRKLPEAALRPEWKESETVFFVLSPELSHL